jgi:hypothetical protein
MTRHDIADMYGDELLFIDPEKFDKCIIGIASRCGMQTSVVYDREELIKAYMDEGMSEEEAVEYIAFNVEGAYVGETTPLIMERV